MHWAAHKHTAAEVIYERADAEKENMGLSICSLENTHISNTFVSKKNQIILLKSI